MTAEVDSKGAAGGKKADDQGRKMRTTVAQDKRRGIPRRLPIYR
jgi:hypothetical protein